METNNSKEETQTMRNLRKIVALVLAFAMVLSMSAVSFAAEMTAAEKAETLGFLKGDGDGVTAEYLAKTPTRLQAAIISLRLRGLEDEALAFEGTDNFADADDIAWDGGKAVAAYLYANSDLGWIGDGTGLKPNEPISAQAYVKVMLEALGYVQGTDFEWDDVFTFAASKGLTGLSASTTMTNSSLATGSVEALAATTKGGDTLVDTLVEAGAIEEADAVKAGLKEEVKDFAFVKAEPFGLKAIKVTFTSDIDDDEDYEVSVDDGDVDVEQYSIDGNEMVVVLKDVQDQTEELDLEISAFGTDGIEIDELASTVKMVDKEDPELISVTVENAKTFVVKFSEPIDDSKLNDPAGTRRFDEVLLDDTKITGKLELSDDLTELTYTANDAFDANTYVFTMEEATDFAGFVSPEQTRTVTVVADNTAPQLVEVKVESTTEIILVFDEDVEDIGDITVAGEDVSSNNVDIDDEEVTLTLTEADKTVLTSTDAFVSVKVTWEDVEDVIGNKEDNSTTFKATLDDKAPTVEVKATEDNYIALEFSEDVFSKNTTSVVSHILSNITVTDEDDDDVKVAAVYADERKSDDYDNDDDAEDNIYIVALDDMDIDAQDYTVNIDTDDIIDGSVFENELAEVDVKISMNDTKKPALVGEATIIDTDKTKQTVRLTFDEEMNSDELNDESNYILNGSPLKEWDYDLDVNSDNKTVDIEIDLEDETLTTLDGITITMYGLEDLAENGLASNSSVIELAVDTFADVTFKLTSVNEIEVKSKSHSFSVADPDDFKLVDINGNEISGIQISDAVVDADDDDTLILELNNDLNPDATTDNATALYVKVTKGDTVDTNDIELEQAPSPIADDVAPTAEIELDDTNESLVVVTFDEIVKVSETNLLYDLLVYNKDDENYEELAGIITYYDVAGGSVAPTAGFIKFTFDLDTNEAADVDSGELTSTDDDVNDDYTIELLSRNVKDVNGKAVEKVDEDTFSPE